MFVTTCHGTFIKTFEKFEVFKQTFTRDFNKCLLITFRTNAQ